MFYDNSIVVARWPRQKPAKDNWGDKLNPELIGKLSGLPVVHCDDVFGWQDRPIYRAIGSGLKYMSENDIIWGLGFIDWTSIPAAMADKICAVRGPLSRKRLLDIGMACPETYGDPAVLYPLLYRPVIEPTYDFGVILHCREAGVIDPIRKPATGTVLNIDICGELEEVVRKILSCRTIISSSLHGIICAHAYGVPSYWLKASELPLGDDFKFHDYFHSIGWNAVEPTRLDSDRRMQFGSLIEPSQPLIDGLALIDSCPFISLSRKTMWKEKIIKAKAEGVPGTIFK